MQIALTLNDILQKCGMVIIKNELIRLNITLNIIILQELNVKSYQTKIYNRNNCNIVFLYHLQTLTRIVRQNFTLFHSFALQSAVRYQSSSFAKNNV